MISDLTGIILLTDTIEDPTFSKTIKDNFRLVFKYFYWSIL